MADLLMEELRAARHRAQSLLKQFLKILDSVHIAPGSLVVILFFLVSAVLCLSGCLMLLCCKRPKRGTKGNAQKELLCKKGLFALMLARLDEFDSLTPLIVTPNTPLDNKEMTLSSSSSNLQRPSSTSPPPPRRPQGGRTLLVPLNTRYRSPAVPLLGTPESRVTTFEAGTTKSCATIPEDDEETYEDLVSIDRTSFSTRSDAKSQRYFSPSAYNLYVPGSPPEFQVPTPAYDPPEPPSKEPIRPRPQKLYARNEKKPESREIRLEMEKMMQKAKKSSPETPTNSLSSPQSSLGSASPVDTTGSLSDSFCIDPNYGKDADKRTDVDPTGKYQLHRIEEESEHFSEELLDKCTDSQNIARSVSQQFELLQLQHHRQSS
ncbi:unnamed protein product, partial [Mesorhabditis spiculigera]